MTIRRVGLYTLVAAGLAAIPAEQAVAQSAGGPRVIKVINEREQYDVRSGGGAGGTAMQPTHSEGAGSAVDPDEVGAYGAGSTVSANPSVAYDAGAITMFYTPDCGHCRNAFTFFEAESAKGRPVPLRPVNINTPDGQQEFTAFMKSKGLGKAGVPTFVVGNEHISGFSEQVGRTLLQKVGRR